MVTMAKRSHRLIMGENVVGLVTISFLIGVLSNLQISRKSSKSGTCFIFGPDRHLMNILPIDL